MLRPATPDDVTAILAIEVGCFGTAAYGAGLIEASLADEHQDVLVDTSGRAYGVVRVSGEVADLDRIAVLAPVRRSGVARGMLEELMRRASGAGAVRMLLEVAEDNVAAIALYDASGFVPIHRRVRYYAGGVDAVVMQRPLAL